MHLLPLLALLSWSPAAFAADPPAIGEQALADAASVATFVRDVRQSVGRHILLAAAGPDAERIALKVAEALPPGQVRVVRIGYLGEQGDEMRGALYRTGMSCGVRLAPTSAGTWVAATFGDCDAPPPPPASPVAAAAPVAAPPPQAAPTPAATPAAPSAIPGLNAALGSQAAPAAPPPTSSEASPAQANPAVSPAAPASAPVVSGPPLAPLAPPPPPPQSALQATYDLVSLRRVPNPRPQESMPDATWAVRDGRGRTLTAVEFAQRTGDLGAARRIQRETAGARSMSLALTLGGGALAVSGLGLLLARNAGAPAWSSYEPDVSDYRTNAQYFEALAQAEADYAAAQEKHDIVKGDRVWIAGFLAGSGVITMGVAPFAGRGVSARRDVTALYWSKEEADALIVAYNDSVRRQVGLPDPTPVAAPPAPQDEEEEEEEEEDPEADPPEDSPPEPPPPAPDPAGPSGARAPGIQLTPVLAPGWTGLTGTF